MAVLSFDERNAVYHAYSTPARDGAPTFVFVNALTGDADAWEAIIAPRLREQGFGTLSWNFRGQAGSRFEASLSLDEGLIVGDLIRLVEALRPDRAILVGLSCGGLYAAKAIARGLSAEGLVLLNTLRESGPRIQWVNDAMPALAARGGVGLVLDALFPLLVNQDFAEEVRVNFLKGDYKPMSAAHGQLNLMIHARDTDWSFDWSSLALPVLNITGLEDRVYLDLVAVNRLYAGFANARREDWEDAGHLLPLERPERLADSLAAFGAEVEDGP